ncbi:MAG TPA: hypothetical protein ENH11_01965 [Candidatus Acetothermia bacterium]|nr:hypothetical protein [Candidatus Acetothermia bacterium]
MAEPKKPFDHILAEELSEAISAVLTKNEVELSNRVEGVAFVVLFDETIASDRLVKGGMVMPSEEVRNNAAIVPRVGRAISEFAMRYISRHYFGLVELSGKLIQKAEAETENKPNDSDDDGS